MAHEDNVHVGDTVTVTVLATDENGAAVDPDSSVEFRHEYNESNNVDGYLLAAPEVTNPAVGTYKLTLPLAALAAGRNVFWFIGRGSNYNRTKRAAVFVNDAPPVTT